MSRVLIVIPARYASERLPGKLLLDETGRPLITYTIAQAQAVDGADVLVATDDERILAVAAEAGSEAVMTDPGHRSGTDRVAEAARSRNADIVVNIQGDEPEVSPAAIRQLIDTHKAALEGPTPAFASTLVTAFTSAENAEAPSAVKAVLSVPDARGVRHALYFSRSLVPYPRTAGSSAPLLHLGLYAFSADTLQMFPGLPQTPLEKTEGLEQLRILEHGYRVAAGVTAHHAVGIDTRSDYDAFKARLNAADQQSSPASGA